MQKTKYKLKGVMLITTTVAVAAWIMIAGAIFLTQSNSFQAFSAVMVEREAQYLAAVDAKALTALRYDDLTSSDAYTKVGLHQSRGTMTNGNVTGWEDEVKLGSEQKLGSNSNGEWPYRMATINIYKKGESMPRSSLDVLLIKQAETYTKAEVTQKLQSIKATWTVDDVKKLFKEKDIDVDSLGS